MKRGELRETAVRLTGQARALLVAAGHGSGDAVPFDAQRPETAEPLGRALACLWDEMVLVRDGRAGTLAVLGDEIAHAERVLAAP